MPFVGLPTPAPDLLRAKRPASRNLCHRHARPKRLSDNPPLLLIRPPSSTARPRQNLDPPKPRLRVVVNYVHSNRSMPKPDLDSQARNDTVQKFHVFDFKRDFCGGAGIFQKRGAK